MGAAIVSGGAGLRGDFHRGCTCGEAALFVRSPWYCGPVSSGSEDSTRDPSVCSTAVDGGAVTLGEHWVHRGGMTTGLPDDCTREAAAAIQQQA